MAESQLIPAAGLLAQVLRTPELAGGLTQGQWETLIWQGRAAELLGQLRHALKRAAVLERVPPPARRHLEVAWQISERHVQAVQYELAHLQEALRKLGIPVVLLKGAAYCAQENSAAIGRVFNDIDILVPKAALGAVEVALFGVGWLPTHLDAYDQRYYRDWMHEIPPMEHKNRSTVLDVHHTIVPPTSGIRPDPQSLFASSVTVRGPKWSFFRVLGPEEMVIHSACHLFFGEFHKGLRDLYDLHSLFSEFSAENAFWDRLVARALDLELGLPVLDALRESRRLFGTDVPAAALGQLQETCGRRGMEAVRGWLFDQVLRPNHPSARNRLTAVAQWLAFARSHWLRMPLPLLVYHLGHKALIKEDA